MNNNNINIHQMIKKVIKEHMFYSILVLINKIQCFK